MHRHLITTVALLPLLVSGSQGAQRWTFDPAQPMGAASGEFDSGGYLGVEAVNITSERLGELKLKEEQGVEVTMVDQDAPAAKAGVKEHDVILTVNAAAVESKAQLHRMIREIPPGRTVTLGISRDGQPLTVKVQLADSRKTFEDSVLTSKDGEKSFHFQMPPLPDFDLPDIGVVYVHSSLRSGVMVENMTPQLGEFFGAKNGSGVLVRSVDKGSRAAKAGLRAGDVIIRVGEQAIHDTSDFTHALRSHRSGSVGLEVVRDKKERTLTLTLPEQKDSGELIEESLDAPELDAETQAELSELRSELAKMQPQMEMAREEARKADREMRGSLPDRAEIRKQTEELRKQLSPQIQKQLERTRKELEKEREHLRQLLEAGSLDI
jgi:membrane-associated protease RseP (regulator of RpoE activity)